MTAAVLNGMLPIVQDRRDKLPTTAMRVPDEVVLRFEGHPPGTPEHFYGVLYRPAEVVARSPEVTALRDQEFGFLYLLEHRRMLSLGCRMRVELVTVEDYTSPEWKPDNTAHYGRTED
jgi:hypothetical protein